MNTHDVKLVFENNFRVSGSPLLKKAIDCIAELEAYNEKLLDSDIKKHNKIVSLEAQIEKMKLCQNCKFEDTDYLEKPCCDCTRCLGDIKRNGNTDKWEIKE